MSWLVSRRDFLVKSASVYLAACTCCSKSAFAQSSNYTYSGCFLHNATDVLGALGNHSLGNSTGVPVLDQGLNKELVFLKSYFGINPAVFTYAENNAFATPERLQQHQYPDGTVVIGTQLVRELLVKFANTSLVSAGDHAISGVVAHEFAHIAFFKSGLTMPQGKKPELHADFLAGWYTGIRSVQLPGAVNIQEISRQMFDIGDFDFNSVTHHGTPSERLSSYLSGFSLSLNSNATASFNAAFRYGLSYVGL